MKLALPVKVILGLATLWPALWLIAEAACMVTGLSNVHEGGPVEIAVCDAIWRMRWSVFLVPVLVVFYLVYIFRIPGWTGGERFGWSAALALMCPPLVMPVFFFLNVWRDPTRPGRPGSGLTP